MLTLLELSKLHHERSWRRWLFDKAYRMCEWAVVWPGWTYDNMAGGYVWKDPNNP